MSHARWSLAKLPAAWPWSSTVLLHCPLLATRKQNHWRRRWWVTGARAPWTFNNKYFQLTSGPLNVYHSAISALILLPVVNLFHFLCCFENVWNQQQEVFYHAEKALRSFSFLAGDTPRTPLGQLTTDATLDPVVGRKWIPLPIVHTIDTFSVSVSSLRFVLTSHQILATSQSRAQ